MNITIAVLSGLFVLLLGIFVTYRFLVSLNTGQISTFETIAIIIGSSVSLCTGFLVFALVLLIATFI